ncbi:hypothetical protein F4861DRAFT_481333 [Xylaria intraflava]|nr:hypothetical protein F4861DRAFT_481333 [Xylaria intraflava]
MPFCLALAMLCCLRLWSQLTLVIETHQSFKTASSLIFSLNSSEHNEYLILLRMIPLLISRAIRRLTAVDWYVRHVVKVSGFRPIWDEQVRSSPRRTYRRWPAALRMRTRPYSYQEAPKWTQTHIRHRQERAVVFLRNAIAGRSRL